YAELFSPFSPNYSLSPYLLLIIYPSVISFFPYTTLFRSRYRHEDEEPWSEVPMEPLGNDHWRAAFPVAKPGQYIYTLAGWIDPLDRKSTRLNSSHSQISYAVFCLKKKNEKEKT